MTVATEGARVHRAQARRRRAWPYRHPLSLGLCLVVLAAVAVLAAAWLSAHQVGASLRSFAGHLATVRAAVTELDDVTALRELRAADVDFAAARNAAGRPWLRAVGSVPGLSEPVGSLDTFVAASSSIDRSAQGAVRLVEVVKGRNGTSLVADGRVDLATLDVARSEAAAALSELDRAAAELDRIRPVILVPAISKAKEVAVQQVAEARDAGGRAGQLVDALPAMLGADGIRTYFFAIENGAELRGAGGGLLSFVLVSFDRGVVTIEDAGSVYHIDVENPNERASYLFDWPADDFWSARLPDARRLGNANWSPHFPTAGHNIAELFRIQAGRPVDGVIAITAPFLARVVSATGPLTVRGVSQAIDGDALVPFLLHDAYGVYSAEERRAINEELIRAVADRVLSGSHFSDLLVSLRGAVPERAVQVLLTRSQEEELIGRVGLDGGVLATENDYTSLVSQNAGANKADFSVRHRSLHTVRLEADGTGRETLTGTIVNEAPVPAESEPPPDAYLDPVAATWLAAYLPGRAVVSAAKVDGESIPCPLPVENREAGKLAVVLGVRAAPQRAASLVVSYSVSGVSTRGADGVWTYRLTHQRQSRLDPDEIQVRLTLPPGAVPVDTLGWAAQNDGSWAVTATVYGNQSFRLRYRLSPQG